MWLDEPLVHKFPELHSFVKNDVQSAESWIISDDTTQFIHTPLSEQAFLQYTELQRPIELHRAPQRQDTWQGHGKGRNNYSSIKMYHTVLATEKEYFIFKDLDSCNYAKVQIFWPLLHDRVNTRNLLRRNFFSSWLLWMCFLQWKSWGNY